MTGRSSGDCDVLASEWLDAEERALAEPDNVSLDRDAARLARAYETAVRTASTEELRLAWESARRIQSAEEIGGVSWAKARRVSELLRSEYEARRLADQSG